MKLAAKILYAPLCGTLRVLSTLAQVKRAHLDVSVIFWCYTVARVFWLVVRVWLGSC